MPEIPSEICLHIGHGKTGSSFIQSSLAAAGDTLNAHGIAYPIVGKQAEAAHAGGTSSGNFYPRPGASKALFKLWEQAPQPRLLISSEAIFIRVLTGQMDIFEDIATRYPGVPLKVICYLRDPVEHAISLYQQQVKRGGFTGTLRDSFKRYNQPARTVEALTRLQQRGAEITVRNHSRHRKDLLATFEAWLNLPAGSLPKPPRDLVNRSLTNGELTLQRLFNRHHGETSRRFVSDALCAALPDIRSEVPPVPRRALADLLERMEAQIADPAYQALVPEAERPHVGTLEEHLPRFPDKASADTLNFTPEQMEVLVRAISREMKKQARKAQAGTA